MSSRNPADWMWTQAIELLEQAERMHRQFFRLTQSERARPTWEPPVDVFEDDSGMVIVVALPGVSADRVEVTFEPGVLVVRAERPLPFGDRCRTVRYLEIPYGQFERRIPLGEVKLETGTRELSNGCLILRLRKASQA
jgi:HSP20 family molecular chaperone IbpA